MAADESRPGTRFGPLATAGHPPPVPWSYWVLPGRLLGGGYPYDPRREEGRLQRLVEWGIDAFVDLTQAHLAGSPDATLSSYVEALAGISPGAVVSRHPIRDMSVPTVADARETLTEIDRLLAGGRRVYVHCWGGIGRTGTIVGCWLLSHGAADPGDVLGVIAELRSHDVAAVLRPAPETSEQHRFVRSWRG